MWSTLQARNIGGRFQPGKPIELPDIACLLFAECVTPAKDIPRVGMFSYVTGVNFLQQQASMNVLNGNNAPPHGDMFKKVVGLWLETRDEVNDLNQLAYFVGQSLDPPANHAVAPQNRDHRRRLRLCEEPVLLC